MQIEMRICPTCLSLFQAIPATKRYCSASCRPSTTDRLWFDLVCRVCTKKFRRQTQIPYCSKRCRLTQQGVRLHTRPGEAATSPSIVQPARSPVPSETSFVSGYHRDQALFEQRMLYSLHGMTWWATPCCYCGDPAEADEHVLPVSAFKKWQSLGKIDIPDDLMRIVPSCHECNSLLGDKVFQSFADKRLYAKAALSRRYHEALDNPHWTPEELATLEGSMQVWISQGQAFRDLVFERLRY